ncbi:MAG: hypothetical protein ACRDWW_00655 [Acidimicrobiales bacterium]
MAERIKLESGDMDWRPAHEVWPGYRMDTVPDGVDPSACGVFVKVLRKPDDGGGCWNALVRFRPPDGYALRITAVASSDEEVYILSDASGQAREGTYTCNPEGLRHGNTFASDTVALLHYHGGPDDVSKIELVELSALASSRS